MELLVVITLLGILAALLLPSLSRAKNSAQRIDCIAHLRQISMGLQLYAGDNADTLPAAPGVTGDALSTNDCGVFYKRLTKSYVGLQGASSPQDKLFACPADTFHYDWPTLAYRASGIHERSESDYASYAFSGGNGVADPPPASLQATSYPGVFGRRTASIKDQSKTVLALEHSAVFPWSWHQPLRLPTGQCGVNNAQSVISFVDGHVTYVKMYWNASLRLTTACYDPPESYGYKWSAD